MWNNKADLYLYTASQIIMFRIASEIRTDLIDYKSNSLWLFPDVRIPADFLLITSGDEDI